MINWNEVKAGETKLVSTLGTIRPVVCLADEYVWLREADGEHLTYRKSVMSNWTIYDPWEDITEWCEFVRVAADGHYWKLYHNNHLIRNDNPNYKVKLPRVWERKDGYG